MILHLRRLDQFLDLFSFCLPGAGTAAGPEGQTHLPGKPLNLPLLYQGEGPDESNLPLKEGLKGKHGADFSTIKYVQK